MAAPTPTLKKVSLAGFATQTPAGKSAKAYPLLPDPDGQVGELVTSILDKSAQVEALEGALELECVARKRLSDVVSRSASRMAAGAAQGRADCDREAVLLHSSPRPARRRLVGRGAQP